MNIVGEMMIKIHLHKYLSTPSIVNKVKDLERAVPQSSSITSVKARLISQPPCGGIASFMKINLTTLRFT